MMWAWRGMKFLALVYVVQAVVGVGVGGYLAVECAGDISCVLQEIRSWHAIWLPTI